MASIDAKPLPAIAIPDDRPSGPAKRSPASLCALLASSPGRPSRRASRSPRAATARSCWHGRRVQRARSPDGTYKNDSGGEQRRELPRLQGADRRRCLRRDGAGPRGEGAAIRPGDRVQRADLCLLAGPAAATIRRRSRPTARRRSSSSARQATRRPRTNGPRRWPASCRRRPADPQGRGAHGLRRQRLHPATRRSTTSLAQGAGRGHDLRSVPGPYRSPRGGQRGDRDRHRRCPAS